MLRKKIIILGIAFLMVLTAGATVVSAASSSWTISAVRDIPHFGGSKVTSESNSKKTNGNTASFNGDSISAKFGNKVRLINSKKQNVTNKVGLYKDKTTHASNSGLKNRAYKARVYSAAAEPSSGNYVKLHFSADKK